MRVEFNKKDRYGRVLGKVMVNDSGVNLDVVESGLAWHYKQHQSEQSSADRRVYGLAEERARSARFGLWRDTEPVPPWDFRRGAR